MTPRPLAPVRAAFRRWMRAQDATEVLAASSAGAWAALAVFVAGLLALCDQAPGARTVFDLRFGTTLVYFLPALGTGALFVWLQHGRERVEAWGWGLMLLGTGCLQFFLGALMALSAVPGAPVFGAFFLFTAAFHGRLLRATPSWPFPALFTALALLAAVPLRRTEEHLAFFVTLGPASLIAQLYLGTFALRHDRATAEAERLRAAVHAQLLEQQERDVGRLSQVLSEIVGYSQDINEALMSAGSAADMLAVAGAHRGLASARVDFGALARELNQNLGHIRERVGEIRQKGRRSVGGEPEAVEPGPVLDAVRVAVGLRFPDVRIDVEAPPAALPRALVRGGASTLRRVVENLVINACEGDGERGASQVRIVARPEALSGRLEVLIEDDGPGFSPERLSTPPESLSSTKPHGTGLGLYTAECLIRASRGTLEWHNAPSGGARLRVLLPGALS